MSYYRQNIWNLENQSKSMIVQIILPLWAVQKAPVFNTSLFYEMCLKNIH